MNVWLKVTWVRVNWLDAGPWTPDAGRWSPDATCRMLQVVQTMESGRHMQDSAGRPDSFLVRQKVS